MSKSEDLARQQICAADQVQSKRGSNSSDVNNTKRPKCVPNPTLDQESLVGAQLLLLLSRFREQGQSLDETRNLEHSAIDLDMFEVSFLGTKNDSSAGTCTEDSIDLDHDTFAASFLETKNGSSAGTGAGTGAGTNHAELVGDDKPAGAAATCTVDNKNETKEKTLVQALAAGSWHHAFIVALIF